MLLIPPTSVGITDKATYSNVEQESTMLARIGELAAGCLARAIARGVHQAR